MVSKEPYGIQGALWYPRSLMVSKEPYGIQGALWYSDGFVEMRDHLFNIARSAVACLRIV